MMVWTSNFKGIFPKLLFENTTHGWIGSGLSLYLEDSVMILFPKCYLHTFNILVHDTMQSINSRVQRNLNQRL